MAVRRQLSVSSSTFHLSLFCDQSCSNQPDQPLILKFCTTEISKERLSNARIKLRMRSLVCALVRMQQNKFFSRPMDHPISLPPQYLQNCLLFWGSNIFQGGGGGGQLFPGGFNCLSPIETHITCDFPGGGGLRTPCPFLWKPHLIWSLIGKNLLFYWKE